MTDPAEHRRLRRRRVRRTGAWTLGAVAVLIIGAIVWFDVSPWPGAMIVRQVFTSNAAKISEIMAPYAPDNVTSTYDVDYKPNAPSAQFDVFWPDGTTAPLPTIVWTHGGAWISGSKSNNTAYYQLLASHGYTVVGLNYGYGPESKYPEAVHEINDALNFLMTHANDYNIDTQNVFLAGDSAGAQLTSQIAAITTNSAYAAEMGMVPALGPNQIRGLILNCGVYDLATFLGGKGLLGWGDGITIWAYTGTKLGPDNEAMKQMSTINVVTDAFPPTYITGGNADPLTEGNSKPFAAKLEGLGVDVTTLFYPADYTPALPHEYQFRLNLDAAQTSLTKSLAFVNSLVVN